MSYISRVITGNMTFMEQRKRYRAKYEKIIDQKLIYETRWYMEKKEILYLKKLKQ